MRRITYSLLVLIFFSVFVMQASNALASEPRFPSECKKLQQKNPTIGLNPVDEHRQDVDRRAASGEQLGTLNEWLCFTVGQKTGRDVTEWFPPKTKVLVDREGFIVAIAECGNPVRNKVRVKGFKAEAKKEEQKSDENKALMYLASSEHQEAMKKIWEGNEEYLSDKPGTFQSSVQYEFTEKDVRKCFTLRTGIAFGSSTAIGSGIAELTAAGGAHPAIGIPLLVGGLLGAAYNFLTPNKDTKPLCEFIASLAGGGVGFAVPHGMHHSSPPSSPAGGSSAGGVGNSPAPPPTPVNPAP